MAHNSHLQVNNSKTKTGFEKKKYEQKLFRCNFLIWKITKNFSRTDLIRVTFFYISFSWYFFNTETYLRRSNISKWSLLSYELQIWLYLYFYEGTWSISHKILSCHLIVQQRTKRVITTEAKLFPPNLSLYMPLFTPTRETATRGAPYPICAHTLYPSL